MTSAEAVTAPARRRAGPWWAWGAALAVVAVVVGWQLLARAPRLVEGDFAQADLDAVDEVALGSVVTDPADGTYDGIWSFRNTGPVPVAVRVASPAPSSDWVQNQLVRDLWLVPVDPETGEVGWADSIETAHLAPGDQVGVGFRLGAGCWFWQAGVGYGASSAVLEVSALGVTRPVTAEASSTAWVRWTHDVQPVAGCS